jgi:hypothetical protein
MDIHASKQEREGIVPKQVLTRRRSWTARIAVLAVVFSIVAVALPASAHSVAISTAVSCPSNTPNAGFTDIGAFGADVQLAINCLAAFDITQGTTATTYSPNGTVLRWQMALFLVRQAADHGIVIPAPTSQGFTDIAGLPQATQDAINQIAQLGISKGTTTTTFSPNDVVTRWQMALFLRRLAASAGITVTDDPAHNQFGDIGAFSAEIQAAINFLADGHIALGTGGSNFSPNDPVFRWAMALFLTRVLAADGVVQPSTLVTVTPTASASQGAGTARTFQATFKNSDGTNYTGRVGVQLVEAVSGAPVYNDQVESVIIEAFTDSLTALGVATVTGVAGTDGSITFTIRHQTGAGETDEDTIPVVWQDTDLDGTYESTGNFPPNEPFGLGGLTDFVQGAQAEAPAGPFVPPVTVTETTKASDVFEATGLPCTVAAGCSYFYDSNDIFTVGGAAATLQAFEDALSVNDTLTGTYDPDVADQSTFNLTNAAATFDVTDPGTEAPNAGPSGADADVSVDAGSYAIKGTGQPGATANIRSDVDGDGLQDAGDNIIASATVDPDGNWTVTVPLVQGAANEFLATQTVSAVESAPALNVATINEAASAGATFTTTSLLVSNANTILDPGDTIRIDFSENLAGVDGSDTITVVDVDGSTATITRGLNSTWTVQAPGDILDIAITAVLPASGGTTGGINNTATVSAVGGFTDDDGEAINTTSNPAGRTFTIA